MSNTSSDHGASEWLAEHLPNHPWLEELPDQLREELRTTCHDQDREAFLRDLNPYITDEQFLKLVDDPAIPATHIGPSPELIAKIESEARREELTKERRKEIAVHMRMRAYDQAYDRLKGYTDLHYHELQMLNHKYTLVKDFGGKVRVCSWYDDIHIGQPVLRSLATSEWAKGYNNRKIKELVPGKTDSEGRVTEWKPKLTPLGNWWLDHAERNEKDRAVFAPGERVKEREFQLWQGWTMVHPERLHGADQIPCGNKHLPFLDFMEEVICGGDIQQWEYLWKWMANAVQNPGKPGQVAVVLRTKEEGTGKGTFAECFGALFGGHYLAIGNGKHLTGSFNAHLRTCILLFADEALFHGNHEHQNILKTIITEPRLIVEGKGIDAEQGRNCTHIIIASNEDHVVFAGQHSRRFFVPDMSVHRMQDTKYFTELKHLMLKGGGCEDMFEALMAEDLSDWSVFKVPMTKGLQEQRDLSADDPLADQIAELLGEVVDDEQPMAITSRCLLKVLEMEHLKGRQVEPVSKAMYALGFRKDRARPPGGSVQVVYRRGVETDCLAWVEAQKYDKTPGWEQWGWRLRAVVMEPQNA